MTHIYVADLAQYPTPQKVEGYNKQDEYHNRYKKTAEERAQLFALKLAYEQQLKKEYGPKWKQALRKMSAPFRTYNHTIISGAKIIAQW